MYSKSKKKLRNISHFIHRDMEKNKKKIECYTKKKTLQVEIYFYDAYWKTSYSKRVVVIRKKEQHIKMGKT